MLFWQKKKEQKETESEEKRVASRKIVITGETTKYFSEQDFRDLAVIIADLIDSDNVMIGEEQKEI